jgi:hypothetical protein
MQLVPIVQIKYDTILKTTLDNISAIINEQNLFKRLPMDADTVRNSRRYKVQVPQRSVCTSAEHYSEVSG